MSDYPYPPRSGQLKSWGIYVGVDMLRYSTGVDRLPWLLVDIPGYSTGKGRSP